MHNEVLNNIAFLIPKKNKEQETRESGFYGHVSLSLSLSLDIYIYIYIYIYTHTCNREIIIFK